MKEIVIAILVRDTSQSPSTTTQTARLMGRYKGRPRDCANVGWMSGDCSGSMSKGEMMSAD